MRLLADENIPLAAVRALRAAGHDVAAIAEDESGLPDRLILLRFVPLTPEEPAQLLLPLSGAVTPPKIALDR